MHVALHYREPSLKEDRRWKKDVVCGMHGDPTNAAGSYPRSGLLLSPMIASPAMTSSSVSLIGNVLRLRQVGL